MKYCNSCSANIRLTILMRGFDACVKDGPLMTKWITRGEKENGEEAKAYSSERMASSGAVWHY